MWFKIREQQVELFIVAKPKARKTVILAVSEQGLQIAIHAKPVKGEANRELITYLAKLLKLPKNSVVLKRGEESKYKCVVVPLSETVQQFIDNPIEHAR